MAEIREKDGYRYSLEPFNGYKYRAKFVADTGEKQVVNTDVYTDNVDKYHVEAMLKNSARKKYGNLWVNKIIHWSSAEQDKHESKFLDEILKDLQ